jgi:hypothetical protein
MQQFCQRMLARLEFRSKGGPMSDIRQWAERWEAVWFRSNQAIFHVPNQQL